MKTLNTMKQAKSTKPETPALLCPDCGKPLKLLGDRWCGKKLMPLYACRGKGGCGRFTFYPVHEYQHTLLAANQRADEATAKNTLKKES